MRYIHDVESPLGTITLVAEDNALIGLWFVGQKYYGGKETLDLERDPSSPLFQKAEKWLHDYFSGKEPKLDFPLHPKGTDFQSTIWSFLLEIPYGKTISYGDLAAKYAELKNIKKMSARGVGSAVGKNPISLIIPCHRVVGSNGKLTGYAGGLERKERLLKLEKAI